MKLKEITEKVFFIPNVVNIGVLRDDENSIILIDTGLDKSTGKKILRLLDKLGLVVKTIINTHSHADHCGGNNYIQKKTNAEIYAPEIESTMIEYPYLEPWYLYSGANPVEDLKNKFLMAQPSNVNFVLKKDQNLLEFNELDLKITSLPGHAPNQIGIEVNSVYFCADVLFSEEILEKHKIPFFIDIEKARETLIHIKESQYAFYVPSHAKPAENMIELVDANLNVINTIEKTILEDLQEKKTTEQVLKNLCDHFQVTITGTQQYFLLKTPIMAYLSSLYNSKRIQVKLENNLLFWEKSNNS